MACMGGGLGGCGCTGSGAGAMGAFSACAFRSSTFCSAAPFSPAVPVSIRAMRQAEWRSYSLPIPTMLHR